MTRRRKWALAALVAGGALPIAGWGVLQTDRARTALREKVIATVESSIQGELEIRSVRVEPSLSVRVDGLRLLAPDGAVAVTAETVHVRIDPSSIWKRRPVIFIAAATPVLDLTPAEDGTTALSRALTPDVPATEEEKGSHLSLVVSLRGGTIVRGPPPGSPENALAVRAEGVSLDGPIEILPDGVMAKLSASTQLKQPYDESLTVRTRLDTRGGAISLDGVRLVAGRSRVHGSSIRISTAEDGGFEIPEGILDGTLRAGDLARWTGRQVPGDLRVEATSADGRVALAAHVDGGGELFAVAREDEGTWTGSLVARDIVAPAWGLQEVGGAPGGVASFALRTADGAWGAHVSTSRFGWRGAVIEPATATAYGRGGAEVFATVSRFAVMQDGHRWALVNPAMVSRIGGHVDVRDVLLEGPGGQSITADGTWPPSKSAPMTIATRELALEDLPHALLPATVRPRGRLDLVARLDAAPRTGDVIPDGRISLRLRHGNPGVAAAAKWLPAGDLDIVANAVLGERRAKVTLDARASSGESLRATVDAPLRLPREKDHAHVDIRADNFTVGQLPHIGGRLQAGIEHRRVWFLARADAAGREIVRAGGSGKADIDAIRRERRIPAFAAWIEHVDGAALSTAGLLPAGIAGTLRGGVTSDGSATFAALTADGVRWNSWIDASFSATAQASGRAAIGSLRMTTAQPGTSETPAEPRRQKAASTKMAALKARPGAKDSALRDNGAIGVTVALGQTVETIPLAGLKSYRFAIRGVLQDIRLAEAVAKKVPEAMRTAPDADGRIDAAVALDGASGIPPSGWAWLAARDLVVEGVPAGRIDGVAHLRDTRAAAAISAKGSGGGKLAALARLGPWGNSPLMQAPFTAVAAADDFDLSALAGFVREVATGVSGKLKLRGVAGGTLASPVPRGRIDLTGGALRTRDIGRLHGISLASTITPDEIVVEELSARGPRGGPLVAHARAVRTQPRALIGLKKRTDPRGWKVEGTAKARNFTVVGERFGGSFDGGANMAGQLNQPLLVARIELDAGTIRLPDVPEKRFQSLDEHPDFAIVTYGSDDRVLVAGREVVKPVLRTRLHVVAPGNLRVTGKDVDLLLSADVKVDTGGEDGMSLTGEVRALRGHAKVAGKKFTVERARIGFPGAPVAKARLDINADHVVEANGPDDEPTTIHARVAGTVEDPKVEFTSDPPMPEDAVVSMLFLGVGKQRDPAAGDDPNLAGRAATLLGNYLTTKLRDQVQEVVPVDVLELETGGSGSSEGRLKVGKYLAPGLFLSYARAFGAAEDEGVNNVRLEWRLRRRWQVISEITDGNRGHVDLVWTREF